MTSASLMSKAGTKSQYSMTTWEGVQDGGDTYIPVANPYCYMAKTITIL